MDCGARILAQYPPCNDQDALEKNGTLQRMDGTWRNGTMTCWDAFKRMMMSGNDDGPHHDDGNHPPQEGDQTS